MRVVDMDTEQLRLYIEANYSIHAFLLLLSRSDILDAIKDNENIWEQHDE